jgi:hypothetical protein
MKGGRFEHVGAEFFPGLTLGEDSVPQRARKSPLFGVPDRESLNFRLRRCVPPAKRLRAADRSKIDGRKQSRKARIAPHDVEARVNHDVARSPRPLRTRPIQQLEASVQIPEYGMYKGCFVSEMAARLPEFEHLTRHCKGKHAANNSTGKKESCKEELPAKNCNGRAAEPLSAAPFRVTKTGALHGRCSASSEGRFWVRLLQSHAPNR